MQEILQTDDQIELALVKSVFAAAGIPIFVFDEHMSTALGGFGAWTPARIMVADEDLDEALDLLDRMDEEYERNSEGEQEKAEDEDGRD